MRPDTPPPSRQTGFQTGSSLQHNSPYSLIYEEHENLPTVKPQKTVLKSNASTNAVLDARLKAKVAEALAVEDEQEAPPDGGCLAWSIVFASFMVSFLQDGFRDSFGLLLPAISVHFNTGRTEAAMTNSIMTLLTLGSGPLVAFLVSKAGHRRVTIAGVVMATTGLLIAGFSIEFLHPPSLAVLYITVGLMTGLGFGLMYLPAMDIIELYFDKNLGLATGIAAAGSGLGQLIMAPVIHIVESELGLSYTMIVLAASVAFAVFFAFIYKKPGSHRAANDLETRVPYEGVSDLTFFHENVKVVKITVKAEEELYNVSESETGSTVALHAREPEEPGCLLVLVSSYARIFTSPAMAVLLVSHFLMHVAIFAAFSFTADRAATLGIDKQSTAHLLSIMGVCNCFGRILFGKALDVFRSHAFTLTTAVLVLNAGIVALSDFMVGFPLQAVYAGVFGATFGAYISSVVVILKIINQDKITESLGVSLLVFALASLVGPAIVGQIFDTMGSYRVGFLSVGGLGLFGALLLPVVQILVRKRT